MFALVFAFNPRSQMNLGLMGHVDSGKTTLAKSLSSLASTAAFDKHPQSKERGITLDLGFSKASFSDLAECTLVDCPGHASLLWTVIGGIHLIDAVILVIDATKGIELQTRECILLAEVFQKPVIVALNKMDLIAEAQERERIYCEISKMLPSKYLIVGVSALVAKEVEAFKCKLEVFLRGNLREKSELKTTDPALFMVDHVFAAKGHGTVFTGTLLSGMLSVGEAVAIGEGISDKKIRSIHVFKEERSQIVAGERAGICLPTVDKNSLGSERLLIASKKSGDAICRSVDWLYSLNVKLIKFFKEPLLTGSSLQISIGHETCQATLFFIGNEGNIIHEDVQETKPHAVFISLDHPIEVPNPKIWSSIILAHKQQQQQHQNYAQESIQKLSCRFAFHGILTDCGKQSKRQEFIQSLCLRKQIKKYGKVDRIIDERQVLVRGLKCELGARVEFENGTLGTVQCFFGQNGKMKVDVEASEGIRKDSQVVCSFTRQLSASGDEKFRIWEMPVTHFLLNQRIVWHSQVMSA